MIDGPVTLTTDGKDQIIQSTALVKMMVQCRFASVESDGNGQEVEVSWARGEHSKQARTIVAELHGKDSRININNNVEVQNRPAVAPVPELSVH